MRSAVLSGAIVRARKPPTPAAEDAVRTIFVRDTGVAKKVAVCLSPTADAPATVVSRGGRTLEREEILDAIALAGLHVDVVYTAPASDSDPIVAARIEIGELTMPNDMTGIPTDLVIEEIDLGDGAIAAPGQTVAVHYTGWLRDGTKFDSSKDRGQPFQFKLGAGQVIRGWDLGVAGMKVGGKRRLVIPPDLGYGARGAGGTIPPNAVLVFEVELLGVR